jgi:DNA mismatch repair protein MutL
LGLPPKAAVYVKNEEGSTRLEAILALPENHLAQQGIWIFVQGRHVVDRTIQQAIIDGYRNLLMHQQFPQAVISLHVDPQEVDVNVHPSKTQVKFIRPSQIFRFVSSSVSGALAKRLEGERMQSAQALFPAEAGSAFEMRPAQLIQEAVTLYNTRVLPPVEAAQAQVRPTLESEKGSWASLHLIGQFANTYVVTQSPNALVMVDQHAAHERVLFERLKRVYKEGGAERQMGLIEELIELDPEAVDALTEDRYLELFEKTGFTVSRRGPTTIGVSSRPSLLLDASLKPLFERIAEQISEMGPNGALEDVLGDLWASMACHGAIRAGRVLSADEMQALLQQMDEFAFSSFCPHGRPVSVKLALSELEKLFKRIV